MVVEEKPQKQSPRDKIIVLDRPKEVVVEVYGKGH
jgi:hypothetical protein